MITIKKLSTLKTTVCKRKLYRIFFSFKLDILSQKSINLIYLRDLLAFTAHHPDIKTEIREAAREILSRLEESAETTSNFLRLIDNLAFRLKADCGEDTADWDLQRPIINPDQKKQSFPIRLYLDDLRSPFNIGSIIRSAAFFGVEKICLSPDCPPLTHKRLLRSAMGAEKLLQLDQLESSRIFGQPCFALECGGTPLREFDFPEQGIAVIGNEELGVAPELLKHCDNSLGRVSIPGFGAKASLNAGVAAAILMEAWTYTLDKS